MTTAKFRIANLASAAALLVSVAVGSGTALAHPLAVYTAPGNNVAPMNCKLGTKNCVSGSGPVSCGGKTNPCRIDGGPQAWDPFLLPGNTP